MGSASAHGYPRTTPRQRGGYNWIHGSSGGKLLVEDRDTNAFLEPATTATSVLEVEDGTWV
jgi:hypothetical protein